MILNGVAYASHTLRHLVYVDIGFLNAGFIPASPWGHCLWSASLSIDFESKSRRALVTHFFLCCPKAEWEEEEVGNMGMLMAKVGKHWLTWVSPGSHGVENLWSRTWEPLSTLTFLMEISPSVLHVHIQYAGYTVMCHLIVFLLT